MITRATVQLTGLAALGLIVAGCQQPPSTAGYGYGLRTTTVDYFDASAGPQAGLPPAAKPGECYARIFTPAVYDTVTETVVRKPPTQKVETVPAEFQDVQEQVMIKPASKRLEVVPAQYDQVDERIMIRPPSKRLEPVPATYRTVQEQVLVRPAYSVWKRSSELTPAERMRQGIDVSAGDILCLVEVPAEYKTVSKEVVDRPASVREVEVPAEYATVKKTVVSKPETTQEIMVPAEYSTVTVKKLVTPAREVRSEVPAVTDTVSKQVLRVPASTEWRQVLCETNATPDTISTIQAGLRNAGFDPGRVDGQVDDRTLDAVRSFQRARSLPVDNDRYINIPTARALGVRI